ncbi:MAG: hypothetical protein ACXAE3_14050, partial [Candidatus Kariarchaeaceae archaeon]
MGVTAVFLKRAHVDNGLYGLVVRSLGSVPLVIILTLIFAGPTVFSEVRSSFVSIFLTIAALSLILADILIMDILKRKPVGLIVPL